MCNILEAEGESGSQSVKFLRGSEALAAASTHVAFFAMTGGEQLTSNDVFKQAELIKRKESITKMERDEKCEAMVPLTEKSALILQEGQSVENLSAKI